MVRNYDFVMAVIIFFQLQKQGAMMFGWKTEVLNGCTAQKQILPEFYSPQVKHRLLKQAINVAAQRTRLFLIKIHRGYEDSGTFWSIFNAVTCKIMGSLPGEWNSSISLLLSRAASVWSSCADNGLKVLANNGVEYLTFSSTRGRVQYGS